MEKLFQRWYDLISIDSVSGHEVGAADYVAEVLRSMGLEPHYSYFPEDTDRQSFCLGSTRQRQARQNHASYRSH